MGGTRQNRHGHDRALVQQTNPTSPTRLAAAALDHSVLRECLVAKRPMNDAADVAFAVCAENSSFASVATESDRVRRAGHFFDFLYTIRVRITRWDRSRVLVL